MVWVPLRQFLLALYRETPSFVGSKYGDSSGTCIASNVPVDEMIYMTPSMTTLSPRFSLPRKLTLVMIVDEDTVTSTSPMYSQALLSTDISEIVMSDDETTLFTRPSPAQSSIPTILMSKLGSVPLLNRLFWFASFA